MYGYPLAVTYPRMLSTLRGMSVVLGAGPAAAHAPELDGAVADLFDLDVRVEDPEEEDPPACSGDCTNDGCTAATKC